MTFQKTDGSAKSADGTTIGFQKLGTGPSLVVVHGSLSTGDEWLPFATALADQYTCYLMARRGRARSADAMDYSLVKECEDIKAVLDAAGPSASLVGHSYGAICALEAASRFRVPKLVLYEPPLPVNEAVVGPAFDDFRAAVERSEFDEALTIGLKGLIKMADKEVAALRSSPLWAHMAALTPTWVRECEEIKQLEFGVARFSAMASPTLLLVGSVTAAHHIVASQALQRTLPDVRLHEFEGQSHQAHLTATADFAAATADFLLGR